MSQYFDDWVHGDDPVGEEDDIGFQGINEEDIQNEIFRNEMLSSIRERTDIVKVANSKLAVYILTQDQQVLRWTELESDRGYKVARREHKTELIIKGTGSLSIFGIHCDPQGYHCLVTLNSKDTYYVHISSDTAIFLHNLHGFKVTSVAWDKNASHQSTNEILLGTDDGGVITLNIEYDPMSPKSINQLSFSRVIDLPSKHPIHGMQYEIFPGMPKRISVIIATPSTLYQFTGYANELQRPDFQSLFEKYRMDNTALQNAAHDVPGHIEQSQLQFYYSEGRAKEFAWLSGIGLMYGKFPTGMQGDVYVHSLQQIQFIQRGPKDAKPIGIAITNYHLYFLYNDALLIFSKFNHRLVHTIPFEIRQGYNMRGLSFDSDTHSLFAWSNRFLYQIIVDNEDRDMWKYYIEQKRYEDAVFFCESNGSASLPRVKGLYADDLFAKNQYIESASAYSDSDRSFEEVTLKFLNHNEDNGLQFYLEKTLDTVTPDQKAQRTLICTWLVEIYLNKMNCLVMADESDEEEELKHKLFDFFKLHVKDLDAMTTYALLQSHGRIQEWVYFAELNADYELVMLHHINQQQYKKALEKLECMAPNDQEILLYRYTPVLIRSEPSGTVSTLISVAKKSQTFDPLKVIPGLMNVPQNHRNEAIKFEKFCIDELGRTEKNIHNLYLFHLAESDREDELIRYLQNQEKLHGHNMEYTFDPEYALTVCNLNERREAQIYIYTLMKMYSEAVNLALEYKKIELAKENARKPQKSDEELSRKLWKQIANHLMVENKNNIEHALSVMHESEVLKLEDLLPNFDGKLTISSLKNDICSALDDYKTRIEEYRNDLRESRQSSEQVKEELREVKQRCIEMEGRKTCEFCNKSVLKEMFYLFPCQHAFHKRCLFDKLITVYEAKDKHRAKRLMDYKNDDRQLDNILTAQCYLCGDYFIETIHDSLIENIEDLDSWNIS